MLSQAATQNKKDHSKPMLWSVVSFICTVILLQTTWVYIIFQEILKIPTTREKIRIYTHGRQTVVITVPQSDNIGTIIQSQSQPDRLRRCARLENYLVFLKIACQQLCTRMRMMDQMMMMMIMGVSLLSWPSWNVSEKVLIFNL